MRNMTKTIVGTLGLALGLSLTTGLSVTTKASHAEGFALLGHSLSVTNNQYRVNNNFTDSQANDNQTPHIDYPGAQGAVMAIWKAVAEWGSSAHGSGGGDSGNLIGSGGSNFETSFQGTTTSTSNYIEVHRQLDLDGGSTYAFHQRSGSSWRIRYYRDPWTWNDGPGGISGSHTDLQGVGCHEHGHALGLNHSVAGGSPTMNAGCFVCTSQRSISSDDAAGVQAIYGVASATKPDITGLSGSFLIGQVMTITGTNFSGTNNQVWFTKQSSNGTPTKVTGVSSSGGGTVINVTIPAGVQDGDVHVQRNQSGHQSLSPGHPFDLDDGSPQPPVIGEFSPEDGPNAGYTVITMEGINFDGATAVTFDGTPAINFNVVNAGLMTITAPPGTNGEIVDIAVTNADGTATKFNSYTYGPNPAIDINAVTPNTGAAAGGETVTITGPNVVPVFNIKFDGVAATNIQVVSMTELTCETPAGTPGATVDVFMQGSGTDTIVGGYTYDGFGGSFEDIGPGLAGGLGAPVLAGTGDLTPLGAGGTLDLTNAATSAPVIWFIGLTEASLPLETGTLYVFPWLILAVVVTDGSGEVHIPLTIPASAAGLEVFHQMWVEDVTGPFGHTASNGLKLTIP